MAGLERGARDDAERHGCAVHDGEGHVARLGREGAGDVQAGESLVDLAVTEASRLAIHDYLLVIPALRGAGERDPASYVQPGKAAYVLHARPGGDAGSCEPLGATRGYVPGARNYPLPRTCPCTIVFAGSPDHLSFWLLLSAWRRGARRILYASAEGFVCRPLPLMLARKLGDRLVAVHHRRSHAILRRVSALLGLERSQALRRRVRGLLHRSGIRSRVAAAPARMRIHPILCEDDFVPGRVVLANSALAWGGAERQIVYTLTGVREHDKVESVRLICQRLHDPDENLRFYLPALVSAGIAVDQLQPIEQAYGTLVQVCTAEQREALLSALQWLPDSVRLETFRFLSEFLRARPGVVHAWQDATNVSAGIAAVAAGVPRIILSARNVSPPHFAYCQPYMRDAYRALMAVPSVLLTNNSEAGALDYASWLGIPRERITVVRNGLDASNFPKPGRGEVLGFRAGFGIGDDDLVVGSVFRFYPEKRPFLWLDAARRLARQFPNMRFLVVGEGPLRDEVRKRAAKAGIADRFVLPGSRSDVHVAMSAMDVFLLTSRHEGTPNVLLEAQLLGVPVVTTMAGGAEEAVNPGESGLCVAEASGSALARAVARILEDQEFRRRTMEAGPSFVRERFGLDRMVRETVSLYGLETGAGPAPSSAGGITELETSCSL